MAPPPPKFKKLVAAARKTTAAARLDENVGAKARKRSARELAPRVPEPVEPLARPSKTLGRPVGFDETTCLRRIAESKKTEFKIDKEIGLKATRYLPFGSAEFYDDAGAFYRSSTSLCCLWCTESFESLPIAMPMRFRENTRDRSDFYFSVTGQFCSFACMLSEARRTDRLPLARFFLKKVYSLPLASSVEFAPDRRSLKKFGGYYTIEEFRACGDAGIQTAPVSLPLMPENAGITEIERETHVVSEIGGKELARRVVKHRGGLGLNAAITRSNFSNRGRASARKPRVQEGSFKSAPSIEEQLKASSFKLNSQMAELGVTEKKKPTITTFLKLKKSTI